MFVAKSLAESFANFCNNIGIWHRNLATLPETLQGNVVVITGANSGIGKFTAQTCAKLGAKVILCCRDLNRSKSELSDLLEDANRNEIDPSNVNLEQLDLSSLQSVRDCAERINKKVSKIDLLINNAGIMMCPESRTVDGIEMQFGTNHLGHFLFTNLLLDKIRQSPKARIINLSSIAHMAGEIHFDNINLEGGVYSPLRSYGQSKLANLLFTIELAERLKGTNITTYAVHPGLVNTNLKRHLNSFLQNCLAYFHSFCLISSELGAQTTLYCAFEKDLEKYSGHYFQ